MGNVVILVQLDQAGDTPNEFLTCPVPIQRFAEHQQSGDGLPCNVAGAKDIQKLGHHLLNFL